MLAVERSAYDGEAYSITCQVAYRKVECKRHASPVGKE
jgi:hypothetical protein